MTSPTARTLAVLRKDGWTASVVERWNAYAKIRQDLFGFIDIIAIRPDTIGVLAIQATSAANHATRVDKVYANPHAETWLRNGNLIEVRSWSKKGDRGKRKLWTERIEKIELLFDTELNV